MDSQETLEVLNDEKLMKQIRQGEKNIAAGRIIKWENLKEELRTNDSDASKISK